MMDEKEFNKKRFIELSKQASDRGQYTYSDFLNLAEISDLLECKNQLYSEFKLFGGYSESERCIARFGNENEIGYEEEFPISCIKISPLQIKYSEQLTHRDYLGSLMNLGIERSKMGDIIVSDGCAFLFVINSLANLICDELVRVRHTSINAEPISKLVEFPKLQFKESVIQIKSERIDLLISKVFNLSRSQASDLFVQKKVFCDGREIANDSIKLKENSIISVRGFGRFIYSGITGSSKKGNLYAKVMIFK